MVFVVISAQPPQIALTNSHGKRNRLSLTCTLVSLVKNFPTMSQLSFTVEHPHDVLRSAAEMMNRGARVGLAVLIKSVGGAVRNPGALMAVDEAGNYAGYLSGGCIDADVVAQAVTAITANQTNTLRYGQGSPFPDILLPCGGSLDIAIDPNPSKMAIQNALNKLNTRESASFELSVPAGKYDISIRPKLRLRIAGRGADAIALARLASSIGIECQFQSPDEICCSEARELGLGNVKQLITPNQLPDSNDDSETAFVLMFHDREWEVPLILDALAGNAFYIGAVGSKRTHERRCEELKKAGCNEAQIDRIFGPIGLIPAMRDATMLAISALSEIVSEFHKGS